MKLEDFQYFDDETPSIRFKDPKFWKSIPTYWRFDEYGDSIIIFQSMHDYWRIAHQDRYSREQFESPESAAEAFATRPLKWIALTEGWRKVLAGQDSSYWLRRDLPNERSVKQRDCHLWSWHDEPDGYLSACFQTADEARIAAECYRAAVRDANDGFEGG